MNMIKKFYNYTYFIWWLIVFFAIALLVSSQYRLIDGDEGFYSSAIQLVSTGQTPYIDFFFVQAPLYPYIYGIYYKIVGGGLLNLRYLSVIFSVLTLLIWAWYLIKQYGPNSKVAFIAILVYLLNPYLYIWSVVVKTYAISNFLISLTFVLLYSAITSKKRMLYFWAGITFAICCQTRILYSFIGVAIFVWIILDNTHREALRAKSKNLLAYIGGVIIAVIPIIFTYSHHVNSFLFGNIGYHLLRREPIAGQAKISYIVKFLWDIYILFPCLVIQTILALAGIGFLLVNRNSNTNTYLTHFLYLVIFSLLVFVITSLIPYPLYSQYFTAPLMPFLFPLISHSIYIMVYRNSTIIRSFFIILFLCGAIALLLFIPKSPIFWNSGKEVWNLSSYYAVSKYIEENTSSDDVILSFWPGYVFESKRKHFPGMENNFGLRISRKIMPQKVDDYHLTTPDRIIHAMKNNVPDVVIVGHWMIEFLTTASTQEIREFREILTSKYTLEKKIGPVEIYSKL